MNNGNTRRILSVALVLLLLLSLMGCATSGNSDGTEPTPTSTEPAPTETQGTEPVVETNVPEWLPENFELSGVQTDGRRGYRYTGTDTEIPMETLGVTLHLPQEWAGQVEVFIYTYYGDDCGIYVVNKELAEAHLEAMEKHYQLDQLWLTYYDYLLRLSVARNDDKPEPVELDEYTGAEYLGTNGTWRYVVHSNENQETVGHMNSDMALNEALIYEIGQEAYENLRRQMVCTHQQALEIVEIHGLQ